MTIAEPDRESDRPPSGSQISEFGEMLVKIGGAFSLTALILTIFHELGFYYVAGAEFRELMTTSDYFSSAFTWLPETMYFAFIAGVVTTAFHMPRLNRMYRHPGASTPAWELTLAYTSRFTVIGAALVTMFGPPGIFLNEYPVLVWLTVYVWAIVWVYLSNRLAILEGLPRAFWVLMLIGPVLITNSYLSGVREAYIAFMGYPNAYTLEETKANAGRNVIVLRNLDKGLLVRDPVSTRTEFIKWDQVAKLAKVGGGPRAWPLSCEFFGLFCGKEPSP